MAIITGNGLNNHGVVMPKNLWWVMGRRLVDRMTSGGVVLLKNDLRGRLRIFCWKKQPRWSSVLGEIFMWRPRPWKAALFFHRQCCHDFSNFEQTNGALEADKMVAPATKAVTSTESSRLD